MYFTHDRGGIHHGDLHGENFEKLEITYELNGRKRETSNCDNLTLDTLERKMYWLDEGSDSILRANLDGSNADVIYSDPDIEDIALDMIRRKLYVVAGRSNKILRMNLDGSKVEDVFTGLSHLTSIALDARREKIYWTGYEQDWNLFSGVIHRANLDRSRVEDLVTGIPVTGNVALDVSNEKVYWANNFREIWYANLNGSDDERLITGNGRVDDIAVGLGIPDNSIQSPDLVVELHPVANSILSPGKHFELPYTIRNKGSGRAPNRTIRFYLSTDPPISTSDTEIDKWFLHALDPNGSVRLSQLIYVPTTPGTYYYGVCVDSVANESDTTNNCSTSVKITVQRTVVQKPDLVVEPPRVSKSTLSPGERFTLYAKVKNREAGQAPSTTLRYYLSTDADIDNKDILVDTDSVSALAAYSTSDESVTLNAPTTPGTYYYYASVSRVANESNTFNNWSRAVKVTVQQQKVAQKPDLVVESVRVSKSTLAPGESFRLDVTVADKDTAAFSSTTLRYYRSSDNKITISDTLVVVQC